jgi:ubiquitin C-terminal hydrolase
MYNHAANTMMKNRTPVNIKPVFHIDTIAGIIEYNVTSIISHVGSESSGHYICHKKYAHTWFQCSDDSVKECEFGSWAAENVYMIFGVIMQS